MAAPTHRVALVSALAMYILFAPVVRHVFHIPMPWFTAWFMYKGKGGGICDIRLYERTPEGLIRIDRAESLGYGEAGPMPLDEHRVMGARAAVIQAKQICLTLPTEDLRGEIRCGRYDGWHERYNTTTNLCRTPVPNRNIRRRAEASDED